MPTASSSSASRAGAQASPPVATSKSASQAYRSSTAAGAAAPEERFRQALAELEELLDSTPAAEELASSWFSQKRPRGSGGDAKGKGRAAAPAPAAAQAKARLQDLVLALDSGRRAPVPIPMRVGVLALKASWHADGTWPLLGCDEALSSVVDVLADSSGTASQPVDLPHSIHPSSLLLRPPGQTSARIPRPDLDDGPRATEDPGPDVIAERYRSRGTAVDDAVQGNF